MKLEEVYPGRWGALLVPLCGRRHTCNAPGKVPHMKKWQSDALDRMSFDTNEEVAEWVQEIRQHLLNGGNVGLAIPPGLVALDIDAGPEYVAAAREIFDEHPIQNTGNGVHVWARIPGGEPKVYATHYGQIPVTVRHVGNQCAVWPSVHVSGRRYEWEELLPDFIDELPALDPGRIVYKVPERRSLHRDWGEASEAWRERISREWLGILMNPGARIPPGHKHEARVWYAWHLAVCGLPEAEIHEAVRRFSILRCETTLSAYALDRECQEVTRSALAKLAAFGTVEL